MTNQEIVNNLKGLLEEDVNKTLADIPMDYLWAVAKAIDIIGADVKPIVRGEWIKVTNGRGGHECSKCHEYAPSYQSGEEWLSNFCPKCGADMRKESEDTK